MFLRNQFAAFDRRMSTIEAKLDLHIPLPLEAETARPDDGVLVPAALSALAEQAYSPAAEPNGTQTDLSGMMNTLEAQRIVRSMDEETETEPGPYVRPGNPAIPFNHTTLASFLLKWRSIASLVQPMLEKEGIRYIDEFPLRQEEKRGILRVWGRGEGNDSGGSDRSALHDQGAVEVRDHYSEAAGNAASPADCWGGLGGSPGPADRSSSKAPAVVMQPMPAINFAPQHVWNLVAEYEGSIQRMHPLIPPRELHAMIKVFLSEIQSYRESYRESYRDGQEARAAVAKFVPGVGVPGVGVPGAGMAAGSSVSTADVGVSAKRKRTCSLDADGLGAAEPSPTPPRPAKPVFQRTINNAVVLLILALGKICSFKSGKIPDVVPAGEPMPGEPMHGSPLVRNGFPASPLQGSPPPYTSLSHSSGLPSPRDTMGSSRRTSFQAGGCYVAPRANPTFKRNMDVIPGLDYFAYATDILGAQLAGSSLRHVYAWILAGLYHGQLGRVTESYTHIRHAGVTLHAKMRGYVVRPVMHHDDAQVGYSSRLTSCCVAKPNRKLGHFQNIAPMGIQDKHDNQMLFAFWTILQLERYPPSVPIIPCDSPPSPANQGHS